MRSCKSAQAVGLKEFETAGFAVACLLLVACTSVPTVFFPSDPIPPGQVTHRLFEDVLHRAVTDDRVNYLLIQQDERFPRYLAELNQVDPNALPSSADRLAWWINAYNAFAIQGILDGESPRPYVGWYRYFKVREYGVGGAAITLYDLEHQVLRRRFREPRVHFAIVCASTSCPKLQPWAYDGGKLDQQLDLAAREFINDPSRNRFDRQGRVAQLSKIFDWFEDDFMAGAGSVQRFIARYVNDPDLARDLASHPYRIEFLEYDWNLNGTAPKGIGHAGSS